MSLETTLDKIFERYDFLKDEMLKTVSNAETFAKVSKEKQRVCKPAHPANGPLQDV